MVENQITSERYLEQYQKRFNSLLTQRPNELGYGNGSISTALILSYDILKARHPKAAAFLSLCACFDNGDVSWAMLSTGFNPSQVGWVSTVWGCIQSPRCLWISNLDEDWLDSIRDDEESFDGVIRSLLELSFVRRNEDSDSVTIHPVIHEWLTSMNTQEVRSKFLSVVTEVVSLNLAAFSSIATSRLIPHANRCMSLSNDGKEAENWSPPSLFLLSALYYDQCEPTKGTQLSSRLRIRLDSTHGTWTELALKWRMHALTLGVHHNPSSAQIKAFSAIKDAISKLDLPNNGNIAFRVDLENQLTNAYLVYGDVKKAFKTCKANNKKIKTLLLDPRQVCCAATLLAECYLEMRKNPEANRTAQSAHVQFTSVYGHQPMDTGVLEWLLRIKMIIGMCYARQGDHHRSRDFFSKAFLGYNLNRGADHPLTKLAAANLEISRCGESEGLKTDTHICYMRRDLAMGIFQEIYPRHIGEETGPIMAPTASLLNASVASCVVL